MDAVMNFMVSWELDVSWLVGRKLSRPWIMEEASFWLNTGSDISVCHGVEYEDDSFLGYSAV
jgi:hypothetical protein